jgi:hypothetical protein
MLFLFKVCQRWHAVVTILGKGFNIWYKLCLREMGLDALVKATGLLQLYNVPGRAAAEVRKDQWKFWKQVCILF